MPKRKRYMIEKTRNTTKIARAEAIRNAEKNRTYRVRQKLINRIEPVEQNEPQNEVRNLRSSEPRPSTSREATWIALSDDDMDDLIKRIEPVEQNEAQNEARNLRSSEPRQSTSRGATGKALSAVDMDDLDVVVNDGPSLSRLEQTIPSSRKYSTADKYFVSAFVENKFGVVCNLCDRLWFKNDIKKVTKSIHIRLLANAFGADANVADFQACNTCMVSMNAGKLPTLCITNGFKYPERPSSLPPLGPIEERLISPRLPFMQIRRLRHDGNYGILGQVINVPVDVDNMVKQLPRQLDDDYAINVNIKRKLIHKSTYLCGYVKKSVVKQWLKFLIERPLYRIHDIKIDNENFFDMDDSESEPAKEDYIDENPRTESECLVARQHTMIWNEDQYLDIAPGQNSIPMNLIYDLQAEELSFPSIYLGEPREFDHEAKVTPFMMATSETRRQDRRGAVPQHVLYMAMKILRLRVVEGMYNTFAKGCTENVTREMLKDRSFVESLIDQNMAFLKSVPNSVQYWSGRKRDLFAMIRQLGKPTMFLTISANEIRWPLLLSVLKQFSECYKDVADVNDLTRSMRAHLVNEDPVICCLFFEKLVDTIMAMLSTKLSRNPFGRNNRVVDYFKRIEFQHRGSPHAHILLWLNNDPKEKISEHMPATIKFIETLCSVSRSDLPGVLYDNQTHKHTFTCTKRGERKCRFGIPYWPMIESRVLVPLPTTDNRRSWMQKKGEKLRNAIETKVYSSIGDFLVDNNIGYDKYLDIIRSTLKRPTILFKRNMTEIYTNTFNPWIARVLGSNTDLQFILDEYSCASYVVEYVNKSNRGISHLHQELLKLHEENPELSYIDLIKKIGLQILNAVEMSAQEAAWFLLRQPMSQASRAVVYIPTVWPRERHRSCKRAKQMDEERIDDESTDVWTKSKIEKYEDRPENLRNLCLADFVAWYGESSSSNIVDNSDDGDGPAPRKIKNYKRREQCHIIRYCHYDVGNILNYKREMVTLYLPFNNEAVDVLDQNKFLALYDENEQEIMAKRKEYESDIDIEAVIEEIRALCVELEDENDFADRNQFVTDTLADGAQENNEDIEDSEIMRGISVVKKRENVLSKAEYCKLVRSTNKRQRELVLEIIHRIHQADAEPLQIYLAGPAGSGKTFVLKVAMETYNRYTQHHNKRRNAYVACASTGKAAVNLGGTTVHSAFRIVQMRKEEKRLASEILQCMRSLFANVNCIIVDEVSMVGADVFSKVNSRLCEITGTHDRYFGGKDIIFTGDFRQLPPVNATPVYKMSRNNLGGAVLWQTLNYFKLEEVMRQSDEMFSAILTKIGSGEYLENDDIELIESRFRTVEWCRKNVPHAVRLFHTNNGVDTFNRSMVSDENCCVAVNHIIGHSTNAQLVTCRTKLHKMSVMETGGLPYIINLEIGLPYMVTANVDVNDGIVNGAIGILKHFEENDEYANNEDDGQPVDDSKLKYKRVWLYFSQTTIGRMARSKVASIVVRSGGLLDKTWTPLYIRSGSVNLGGTVRCRRIQFPLVPACAITIHKSQGGTFDSIVFHYSKSQQTQLVYVALSRVTSLSGLFLVNDKGNHKFYHGRANDHPSVREIRSEYLRLENHKLNTLTKSCNDFINCKNSNKLIIVGMNVQSLEAHREDIETDEILTQADLLMFSETWMPKIDTVELKDCALVSQCYEDDNVSESSEQVSRRRKAGGVAIYRNKRSRVSCNPYFPKVNYDNNVNIRSDTGDITMSEVILDGLRFIVACIYVHPKAEPDNIKLLLHKGLCEFGTSLTKIIEEFQPDLVVPIFLTGDFNIEPANNKQQSWLLKYLKDVYGLVYDPISPTTLGNTTIDLTFTRGLSTELKSYISYFSYHRPIIHYLCSDMEK